MAFESCDHNPWKLSKRVLPQHTDHAGVMWHGMYVNWLEEARVAALIQVGLPYQEISEMGLEMPVVSLQLNYIRSIVHGESICLDTWPLPREGIRWPWQSQFLQEGSIVFAKANVELVLTRITGPKMTVLRHTPEHIEHLFLKLQNGPREDN